MKWAIDPNHSGAAFTIRHMMGKVRGTMSIKEGWIEVDDDRTTGRVEVILDPATINTGVAARDNHLKSADGHFDVQNYPAITFRSTGVVGNDPARFKVVGDLTLHGITRQVTLDATFGGEGRDPWGNQRASLSAETRLNRKDYGLTWNQALEAGGWLLGDDVKVEVEVEAVPAAKPDEARQEIETTARHEAEIAAA